MHRAFTWLLVAVPVVLISCGSQPNEGAGKNPERKISKSYEKVKLPEFYGVYAIDRGELTKVKGSVEEFSPDVKFIIYEKQVALGGRMPPLYQIDLATKRPEPQIPSEEQSSEEYWSSLKQTVDANSAEVDARLAGIPKASTEVELLAKPVEGKSEMTYLVPPSPLAPGLYELKSLGRFLVNPQQLLSSSLEAARSALAKGDWDEAYSNASVVTVLDKRQAADMKSIQLQAIRGLAKDASTKEDFRLAKALCIQALQLKRDDRESSELLASIPFMRLALAVRISAKSEDWRTVGKAALAALKLRPDDPEMQKMARECPWCPVNTPERSQISSVLGFFGTKLFALDQYSHSLYTCDLQTRKLSSLGIRIQNNLRAWSASPDGNLLAIEDDSNSRLSVYNLTQRTRTVVLPEDGLSATLPNDLSPDGSLLATYAELPRIKKWPASRAFSSADLQRSYSVLESAPYGIVIWNAKTGSPEKFMGEQDLKEPACSIAFSSDGTKLVTGHKKMVCIWNINEQRRIKTIDVPSPKAHAWFADSGNLIILGSNGESYSQQEIGVSIVNPDSGETVASVPARQVSCWSVVRNFIALGNGTEVEVLDSTGKSLKKMKVAKEGKLTDIAISPKGDYMGLCLDDRRRELALWRMQ